MRDDGDMERRVTALEREVAALRGFAAGRPPVNGWLDAIIRRERNDEAYAELHRMIDENAEAERQAPGAGGPP